MESIIARALEYTLKYWLKSFTRDQFKLQGRTAQLSNLDINGDALHSSMGLPPAINVTKARVGKLEIALPSISNVQVEPIVVQIDRLDLVLEENSDPDSCSNTVSSPTAASSAGKGSGYGFADKIADGMTVEVGTVNLLLETRGHASCHEGVTWTPPMASITIKGLVMYTTNENWQVVNLKEARDFSSNKKFIYLFKKLEWESLSIDLLPHPDMFMDARFSEDGANERDDDGAKRVFFGGERFLEGISGEANITVKRTALNDPLGLEVQLHVSEALCPALSEPGLRALLRFLTGLYVCLNRGDVDPKSQKRSTEGAGCSLISIIVDHIFFCIKDTEFRLELLMQAVCFSRASVSDGEISRNLTEIAVGGLFLRDTFSHPPCTLFQPSMSDVTGDSKPFPDFAKSCCPDIYPLGDQQFHSQTSVPFICIYSLQVNPTPVPPKFSSQTAIFCQPLLTHLQEESCFRIASFLADGVVAGRGAVLPDSSINSLELNLKELDIMVPLENLATSKENDLSRTIAGARLCMKNLLFIESPSLKMHLLFLEKDPACFSLWEGQPIDASQKKWVARASFISLSLEKNDALKKDHQNSLHSSSGLWKCIELKDVSIEVAMATPDGRPLICVPPPGGIVRVGVACKQFLSNTSVQQLFFLLDLYAYFGSMSEKMEVVGESNKTSALQSELWSGELMSNMMPSDTAISLSLEDQQVRFLEDSPHSIQGKPLVQFVGMDLFVKVAHRTLGGASAISSTVGWESIEVDCVDDMEKNMASQSDELRAVIWINNKGKKQSGGSSSSDLPFLNASMTHVVPFDEQDAECHSFTLSACIAGIRLGGGMNYTEELLHRFGILGPDGGPGKGLSRGLQNLSAGPLSNIFKPSPRISKHVKENGTHENVNGTIFTHLGHPDDVDVCIDLKDWLFALEGAEEMSHSWIDNHGSTREERCWHSTFRNLQIKAKNVHKSRLNGTIRSHVKRNYPVDFITVGVEGLQTLKPQAQILDLLAGTPVNGLQPKPDLGGVNFEACIVASLGGFDVQAESWEVEKLKFSVDNPIEAVITKDELQHLTSLCKTEVDSIGRISAGILRILKLEQTFGEEALDQLSNLGSGGFDKLLSSGKLHEAVVAQTPEQNQPSLQSMVTAMEVEVKDSRMKCADLIADIGDAEPSLQYVDKIKELESRLEGMQRLLKQLRHAD